MTRLQILQGQAARILLTVLTLSVPVYAGIAALAAPGKLIAGTLILAVLAGLAFAGLAWWS